MPDKKSKKLILTGDKYESKNIKEYWKGKKKEAQTEGTGKRVKININTRDNCRNKKTNTQK
jgi:hypothetical protein